MFILSMFTKEDCTSINNEDRKKIQIRKNIKMYPTFLTFKVL